MTHAGERRPGPFRLRADEVEATFAACLGHDLEVDAITGPVRFDREALSRHAELVGAMLLELPTEFRQSAGGGWSFLQACMDRHGNQWTDLHRTMAMLFALGQGLGLVECQLPRELWDALPGGMPYYAITDRMVATSGRTVQTRSPR